MSIEEEITALEARIAELRLEYEHYFMGRRPTEPQSLRIQVEKIARQLASQPIRNTAQRFRFHSVQARLQSFRRKWEATLREIEAGTYQKHLFKMELREREASAPRSALTDRSKEVDRAELFDAYQAAAEECGQDLGGLTAAKLAQVVGRQEAQLKSKLGCARVDFRVVVEAGRVKVKASAAR